MDTRRFNGATPFQAWKPDYSASKDYVAFTSFNGATPFQTWKR